MGLGKMVFSRNLLIALNMVFVSIAIYGQSPKEKYEAFKEQAKKSYDDFRSQANKQYADFMERAWKAYKSDLPLEKPKEDDVKPIEFDELHRLRKRRQNLRDDEDEYNSNDDKREWKNKIAVQYDKNKKEIVVDDEGKKAVKDNNDDDNHEIKIDEFIPVPTPRPQPKPVSPIREQEGKSDILPVSFFKQTCNIRLNYSNKIKLRSLDGTSISASWRELSRDNFDNAIRDLLEIRLRYDLCDWSYLLLLDQTAQQYLGKETNEAVLFMAYLYCQSGYMMRLATNGNRLIMLFSSEHLIYNEPYFNLDGTSFYIYGKHKSNSLNICDASFPSETPLSLTINKEQKLGMQMSENRQLISKKYPNVNIFLSENKVLMDFYSTYPTSKLGSNDVSRWALYAETPICEKTRRQLYPALKNAINHHNVCEQLSILLNWVQTAFVYEYDDKVWGGDRAFFADETLYYPYCDCEDRSILLTRIVRDLLGLKCALVYYPGHLATAIAVGEDAKGDYIRIDGIKYLICDPTYIGAPIGMTMPDMDNKTAKVIVLR